MKTKVSNSFLIKRFLAFLALYIVLSAAFNFTSLKTLHNDVFTKVISPIHNSVNPRVHAKFAMENRTDRKHYGVSFALYDKSKHGEKWKNIRYRETTTPDITKFPNLHAIVVLPSILLLALILITPISWKRKLVFSVIGILLFYLVLSFYFGYIFEVTINRGDFAIQSLWHGLIKLFGVDNSELLNLFAFLIWALLSMPVLVNQYRQGRLTLGDGL